MTNEEKAQKYIDDILESKEGKAFINKCKKDFIKYAIYGDLSNNTIKIVNNLSLEEIIEKFNPDVATIETIKRYKNNIISTV